MLRKLLAGLTIATGAQFLLPPVFVEPMGSLSAWPQVWTTQAVVAAELSEIRDRGYLIIGVKANRPPLGSTDENGNLVGFEIDIARRLAADLLGDEDAVQFVPLSNVERLNAVLEGRVDIAIAAITLTEPRRRLVNFSDPYYLDGTGFLVQPEIQSLQNLRFGKVALLNRSSSIAHVRYILPAADLVGVETYEAGRALLASGDVDAFAGDVSALTGWLDTYPQVSGHQLLPSVISAEPLSIALPKGTNYHDLKAAINQSIRRWYAEEWLQERAEFWQLPSGLSSSATTTEADDAMPASSL